MIKKPVYLLDGFHSIFRAFYAIRSLATSKGLPTNATYGFLRMLLKVLKEERAEYAGVFFDRPEPTFRNALYPLYKAHREAPPEALTVQIDWIRRVVEGLDIPLIEKPGFEADDLIGTAARYFAAEGHPVVIVSADKDLMQIVSDRITMWDTMKDKRIDREGVKERFGVYPDQVVEVLALSGDVSDNIPGVRGIGEKTASALIQEYGSLDGLYEHLAEIKGKRGEILREQKEQAYLSRQLAKIDCQVEWQFSLKTFAVEKPHWQDLQETLRLLEFNRILPEIEDIYGKADAHSVPVMLELFQDDIGGATSPIDASQNAWELYRSGHYRAIETFEALAEVLAALGSVSLFAFDTETTGLNPIDADLVGISLSWKPGEAVYIPVGHTTSDTQLPKAAVIQSLKPFFENPRWKKVGQNVKFDIHFLRREGIDVQGILGDTMIASYLLYPEEPRNLDDLAQKYLSYKTIHFAELAGKGAKMISFAQVPIAKAAPYASQDADVAYRLYLYFASLIENNHFHSLFYDLEMPICLILQDMEANGIAIDTDKLAQLSRQFTARIMELESEIHKAAGETFNIQSPKQLSTILFEKLKYPIVRRTKTGLSTDSDVLEALARTQNAVIAQHLLAYRQFCKLKSTYVDKLPTLIHPRTGRIHTSFNQTITSTGRLSSSDPNLQNIPIRGEEGGAIREAFVAPPGKVLLSLDYSQIELRILAHLSQDPAFLEVFRNNHDAHRRTASRIFNLPESEVTSDQRRIGKTINFATIYGQGPFSLSEKLRISRTEAKHYIDQYFKEYVQVGLYRERVLAQAMEKGYVETYLGRRRYFPDLASRNKTLALAAERMAFNTMIQGTAADIMKLSMIRSFDACRAHRDCCRLLLQVHDELVLEIEETHVEEMATTLKALMESVVPDFSVPLTVEYNWGKNWAEAH